MPVNPNDDRSPNGEDVPAAHTTNSGGFYMSELIPSCLLGFLMLSFMGGSMIYFAREAGQWGVLLVLAGLILFALAGCAIYWPIKRLNDATVTTDPAPTVSLPPESVLSDEAQKQLNKIENKDAAALCLILVGFAIPFALLSRTPSYIDTQTLWLISAIGAVCIIVGGCLGNKYGKQAAAIRSSSEQTDP